MDPRIFDFDLDDNQPLDQSLDIPSIDKGKAVDRSIPFPTEGKGKGREPAPTLPPLQFSPTQFDYEQSVVWPSSGLEPGPSSYSSGFASIPDSTKSPEAQVIDSSPTLRRIPSRRRSLSNLSLRSDGSPARSISRIRAKLGGSSTLARKLLFRKQRTDSDPPPRPCSSFGMLNPANFDHKDAHDPTCLLPWRPDRRDCSSTPFANLNVSDDVTPSYTNQCKGRSNSSPLPFSAFDIVPSTCNDVFIPIPIIIRNYFDTVLPRELRLKVLAYLVSLHQEEFDKLVHDGQWTVKKASSSKNKYVGRDKGIRELMKCSRVSKSWQALVFDGQLWETLDLCAFPKMPSSLVLRLVKTAGPFIKHLDLVGHTHFLSSTLIRVTDELSTKPPISGLSNETQLTMLNLQGCTALTTRALHYLLARCPALQSVCLRGLHAVTNVTCQLLSEHCPRLAVMDFSRCVNVDGEGIYAWATSASARSLKELRLSGITGVDDQVMGALGCAAPNLEVLDLSYVRDLHNSAIGAFIACDEEDNEQETVLLTSREAGHDPSDSTYYRRRVTRLRHLSLSSCTLLTDIACSHLAHSVPRLEYLELAGIGTELRDDGLIRLLETTPDLRRLDLEDASGITDGVLAALTPSSDGEDAHRHETGHVLEHLVISYAALLTEDALRALLRACPLLRVLEADNTRLSGGALKEFVRLSRRRGLSDARIVAIDCRAVGEAAVREVNGATRARQGWRAYEARRLGYMDGRDREELGVGQDECDEGRVVLKSFYSWQTVDAVRAARRSRSGSGSEESFQGTGKGRARWWSPSGRSNGSVESGADGPQEREGCRIM